jgi:hypothetical protein
LFSKQLERTGSRSHKASYRILGQVQRSKLVYKATEEAIFPAHSPTNLTERSLTKLNKNQILNDGYLGSYNDEERSEVRKAMRIADP